MLSAFEVLSPGGRQRSHCCLMLVTELYKDKIALEKEILFYMNYIILETNVFDRLVCRQGNEPSTQEK